MIYCLMKGNDVGASTVLVVAIIMLNCFASLFLGYTSHLKDLTREVSHWSSRPNRSSLAKPQNGL